MKVIRWFSFAFVGLCLAAPARGSGDDAALVEAGRQVLKSLAPLPAGSEIVLYFELRMGPTEAIGYSVVTLGASVEGGETIYKYTSDTGIHSPTGASIFAAVSTTLRPDFEPTRMDMRRATVDPGGKKQSVVERAVFGPNKVTLSGDDGNEKVSRDVPLPERPFIFGIEMMVQRLDLDRLDSFVLGEFSLHGGGAGRLTFDMQTGPNNTRTIVTRYADGNASYQFWFDRSGHLVRWGEPSMPFLFVRSTKEKVEELRNKIGSIDRPAEPG